MNYTILIGEDEPEVRGYFEMALKCLGYRVEIAETGQEVLKCLRENHHIDAVLLDVVMPRKSGIETLREIRQAHLDLPVIMVSDASCTTNVVEAMRCGATDFLGKPVIHEDLRNALTKALEHVRTLASAAISPSARTMVTPGIERIGVVQRLVKQSGMSDAPILIQGETGSGKEVLARELHANSRRADKPFLKVNCAALPSELVESELFGYERGAFTGAFQKKAGMFEMANGGTILLDEIGDMDFKLQAKLLQVLQDQEFQRIGGKETIRVDVRVIAATHKDLERAIVEQTFREDLYYRLNVLTFYVPSLRERPDDIIPLAQVLLKKHAGESAPALSSVLQQTLLSYHWPGNIRELENVVRRLIVLRDQDLIGREIQARMARRAASPYAAPTSVANENTSILKKVTRAKHKAESEAILAALNATRWNRKKSATLLQIDYKALLYKMKKLGIEGERVGTSESSPGDFERLTATA
jgi:two-component system response regulator AtoC